MINYQEPYGDFLPAHDKDTDNDITTSQVNRPMMSLTLLYPGYIDNPKVFACPSTSDTPVITVFWIPSRPTGEVVPQEGDYGFGGYTMRYYTGPHRWSNFGQRPVNPWDPPDVVGTSDKCSYMYDPMTHFRDIGPSQAIAADADGFAYRDSNGEMASHALEDRTGIDVEGTVYNRSETLELYAGDTYEYDEWLRNPRIPNHNNGQNVLYFDGHVTWMDTNFASDDPADNIYAFNAPLDSRGLTENDVDALVWDGENIPGHIWLDMTWRVPCYAPYRTLDNWVNYSSSADAQVFHYSEETDWGITWKKAP
jgi:prepilin-type processing-associated H-X9-DG protein